MTEQINNVSVKKFSEAYIIVGQRPCGRPVYWTTKEDWTARPAINGTTNRTGRKGSVAYLASFDEGEVARARDTAYDSAKDKFRGDFWPAEVPRDFDHTGELLLPLGPFGKAYFKRTGRILTPGTTMKKSGVEVTFTRSVVMSDGSIFTKYTAAGRCGTAHDRDLINAMERGELS